MSSWPTSYHSPIDSVDFIALVRATTEEKTKPKTSRGGEVDFQLWEL